MARTFRLSTPRQAPGDLLENLNDQQRAVVTAPDGPMLVIAGAGTGKTRALTHRLAWLIRRGVDSSRILLVTFTSRAAREMVHRVQELADGQAGRVWAGTFHHVANRLLRQHGTTVGLAEDFTILDREDAADLIRACVAEAKVDLKSRRFPDRSALLTMHSAVVNTQVPLPVVLAEDWPRHAALREPIEAVLALYDLRKRERQLVDYDDLLMHWRTLLEREGDAAETLAGLFDHVLVDEYQDTNAIQARLVDRMAAGHRNVCVVGDDSQSIYRFRGADTANMLDFRRRYPETREHRLEINYRSTPQILELANASIACNERRLPKTLRAVRPDGVRPATVPCADHLVQSRFIAEYILHLIDQGRGLEDIAVLYRSHWHAPEIQLELQRRDIPFQVRGGLRFFEQAHVKDVLAFLRLRHNGRDELAWPRALRLVPRIGGSLAHKLWAELSTHDADDTLEHACRPETAAALPPAARDGYARFVELLGRLATLHRPAEMIAAVLDSFYEEHLEGRYRNAALRRQDIDGLADFAGQYRTIEAFLSDVALTGDFSAETCEDGPSEQLFVTLSTVHQAKGLEWPVVIIPWMADGRFPTDMAMGTPADLEEERRVFHVAVTRARDELILAVPQVWSNYRKNRILMKPSRFLTEVDAGLTETMTLEDAEPEVVAGDRRANSEQRETQARR